ncbi:hypothetical protein KKF05_01435 [Patescibacteria group bacterium]|nr:hypothetical protein [Patescibacteria group bacterium]MBU1915761.1 hypothetical protein [Patescibacteria group bacterium]
MNLLKLIQTKTTLRQSIIGGPNNFPALSNQLRRAIKRFNDKPASFLILGAIAAGFLAVLKTIAAPFFASNYFGNFSTFDFGYRLIFCLVLLWFVMVVTTALGFAAAYKIKWMAALRHGLKGGLQTLLTAGAAFFTSLVPFLLIIPGLLMSVRFSLLLPVIIAESKLGFTALGRSRNLVYGQSRQTLRNLLFIFSIFFVVVVLIGIFMGVLAWPVFVVTVALLPLALIILQITYEDLKRLRVETVPSEENNFRIYKKFATLGLVLAVGYLITGMLITPKNSSNSEGTANQIIAAKIGEPKTATQNTVESVTGSSKDRDWQRYQDITALRLAVNSFFNDTGLYPESLTELVPKYIENVPKDPKTNTEYRYAREENSFSLGFSLEEGVAQLASGSHNLTPDGFDSGVQALRDATTTVSPTGGNSSENSNPESGSAPVTGTNSSSGPTRASSGGSAGGTSTASNTSRPAGSIDTDGDGLTDEQERALSTDPLFADTDSDGLIDSDEVNIFHTNPNSIDTDGDGITDTEEIAAGTDPVIANPTGGTAGGGTPGSTVSDRDHDGLADSYELAARTNPDNPDTDGDGLADGDEVMIYGTNPLARDTDLDGVSDAEEIRLGTNPLLPPQTSPAPTAANSGSNPPANNTGGGSGSGSGSGGYYYPPAVIEHRIRLFGLHEPTLTTIGYWHPAWPGL